jgi:hypothetical protein
MAKVWSCARRVSKLCVSRQENSTYLVDIINDYRYIVFTGLQYLIGTSTFILTRWNENEERKRHFPTRF